MLAAVADMLAKFPTSIWSDRNRGDNLAAYLFARLADLTKPSTSSTVAAGDKIPPRAGAGLTPGRIFLGHQQDRPSRRMSARRLKVATDAKGFAANGRFRD